MHYNRNMSSRPKTLAALLLSLAAGTAAAQPRVDAGAAASSSAPGASAAASVTSGAQNAPGMNPALNAAPGLNPVSAAPSAPSAAVLPGASVSAPAAVTPGVSAPVNLPGRSAAAPAPSPAETSPAAQVPAVRSGDARVRSSGDALRSGAAARDGAAVAPGAGTTLGGAARKITEARLSAAAGGDAATVSRALDKVFDAATASPALRSGPAAGVAGRAQGVRDAIAQKVGIANTASPADAPSLYQDAIKTAKDALPAPVSEAVAKVVRGFAARKADASLGDLAAGAYQAAVTGAAPETGRLLSAFDKWESLLGAPGKPLVTNAAALKSDVTAVLDKAAAGAAPSAPHVWFAKKDGAYTAVLPGAGVAPIPALAAAFAIAPSALAPETALGDAYRAFSADPRASTGAGLIYRARRTLGASVPAAALSASRFWLRAALESLWRRVVALFTGGTTYRLAQKSGQDALRRDAALAGTARSEAASAERALVAERLTVGGLRSAFGALGRSAAALETMTGESGASSIIESLRRSFEREAAERSLRPADAWPAAGAAFVTAPGGPAHWARRIGEEASRAVDARFWRSRGAAGVVNLGAEGSIAAKAAAEMRGAAALVALDDRLWARGRGAHGEARLSAQLRETTSGGSVEISVERGDAALARRLEDLGLTVFADGAGLRAAAGSQDFARDGSELGLMAARALSAALGDSAAGADSSALRELADETRRDPSSAAKLAALFDGREAFARAPVIGLVGEYEALAPTGVSAGGKTLLVSALRDPDTGLLAYARAAKPDGAPLGAAELRALLRAK